MRIFVALDIDDAIRERISRFMDGLRGFAPDARWVRPESLHVTLKFVGEKPPEFVEKIKRALSSVQANSTDITFRGYGFFPGPKAPRIFWIGIESGPQLASLASAVDDTLVTLGIPNEEHISVRISRWLVPVDASREDRKVTHPIISSISRRSWLR